MASPLVWMPHAISQGQMSQAYAEVIAPAPVRFNDALRVVIPDWTRTYSFVIPSWPQIHGSVLPTIGTSCLIEKDSRGVWHCTDWSSSTNAPTWKALPFNTNWQNYGATGYGGESYQIAEYTKDGLGWISVRGLVATSSSYAFGAASATVGTLPAGARPGSIETFGVYQRDASNNHMIVRLDVNVDGTMILSENEVSATGTGNTGSVSYLSLAGIRFYQAH